MFHAEPGSILRPATGRRRRAGRHDRGGKAGGSEEPDRAEVAARDPAAGQARPPAQAAVRVRPRQGDADAAADRPGHRARPARLLPQPRLQGPRVPVPARGRGRLLGDRLPDRPGDQVLPRLRGPGAADPQGQRQDRRPALRRGALDLQRSVEDAVRLGADAVGYTLYVGSPRQDEDLLSCKGCARTATASACR